MAHSNASILPECYKMLNVTPGVNWVEIKKSYHKLALKFHPDHHPGIEEYENRFKEISWAFKALESHYQSSGLKEYEYNFEKIKDGPLDDSCIIDLDASVANRDSFFSSIMQRRIDKDLAIELKNHITESLVDWEKKAFQLDVKKAIKIDLARVTKGGIVKVRQNQESFDIPIPRGKWNRMKIRIPDKGEASWFRKKRGDLLLDIQVISSQSRKCLGERDLYYDFPVSSEAVEKGKTHTLKTVQGVIKFILPRNAINGQTFVLKAKPSTEEALRTNHIVKIQVS